MKHTKAYLIILLSACCIFFGFRKSADPAARLNEIAKEYKSYHRYKQRTVVADSSRFQWTITLCSVPGHVKMDSSLMSRAGEGSPHGNKLYKLFIKKPLPYFRNSADGQPVGQVIVKETWNVKEIAYDSLDKTIQQVQSRNDGKWYTPTTVSALFIMYKEKEKTTNDQGWNYGTVSIEDTSKKPLLLNDTKISTCISCHKGTKYDRIFGAK